MTEPRIYVSDYASYNAGTLQGKWIDLDGKTVSELQEEISSVLTENSENLRILCEEPMIQDYEGFPSDFYSESHIDLENLVRYLELSEDDQKKCEALLDFGNTPEYAFEHLDDAFLYPDWDGIIESILECYEIPRAVQRS